MRQSNPPTRKALRYSISLTPSENRHRVTDAGDGQPLLCGGRGEQGTGAAEEDTLIHTAVSAVFQLSPQVQAILTGNIQQDFFAHLTQVTGDDQIKILRTVVEVLQMGTDGLVCGWRHGGTHIIGVLDPEIGNGSDGAGFDDRACSFGADQSGAGAGDRPLGGGSSLPTIPQGKAVLPLGGGEVGRCHGDNLISVTASCHHGGDQQAFRHGGAGTVQSQMGDVGIAQGERGTDALIQQIPGQHQIQLGH